MALTKCPKHGLTYNDENPRGCPACAAEKKGRLSESNVMQELARVSRRVEGMDQAPTEGPSWLERLRTAVPTYDQRVVARVGGGIIAVLVLTLFWFSRARWVDQIAPAVTAAEDVRSFPVNTGQDISVVFAILGTRSPETHPTSSSVQRYSYGSGLYVDAINDRVYSITIGVANRSWRGLRVGAEQVEIEGTLALLGTVHREESAQTAARRQGQYELYPSAEDRPRHILSTQVRPPNGCFDVQVDIQPRIWGVRIDGDTREVAVATPDRDVEWVATRIRVADRTRNGPIDRRAC